LPSLLRGIFIINRSFALQIINAKRMATKIRLQRHGKKRAAFYHVVIADERAKRDGKFIEKIGTYNPNTDPATIDLKFDRALHWLQLGAQPTDTARALLSYKGVMLKNHLDKGVAKGALTQAAADKKFEAWMKDKDAKIEGKADSISKDKDAKIASAMAAETATKEAKAAVIAAKTAAVVEEAAAAQAAAEAPAEEAPAAEAPAEEAPAAEAPAEEAPAAEAPAEEAPAAEAPAEEAPAAEAPAEEAPAAEAPAEEAPAAEAPAEEVPANEEAKGE
jgi:small subunit ribosomal protein S16